MDQNPVPSGSYLVPIGSFGTVGPESGPGLGPGFGPWVWRIGKRSQ